MPGIDPSILAAIGGGPSAASPGPAAPPPGDSAPAEPVAIHDACQDACALVQQARAALEDLSSQVEMADDIDPKTEKMIMDAAAMVAKADDMMAQAEQTLAAGRQQHEAMVSGDGDDGPPATPPKAKASPKPPGM